MLEPIPVVPKNPAERKMDPMCRLNYAKPYTVEHNVKSLDFGDVPHNWIPALRSNFALTLQLLQSSYQAPASDQSNNHHSVDENTVLTPHRELVESQSTPPSVEALEGRTHAAGQVQTDSGYHSGKGTDTASVCSIDSNGSSLGIPTDTLQDFITVFANVLLDKVTVYAGAAYDVAEHPPGVIEAHFHDLLRRYAIDLEACIPESNASHHSME